MAGGFLLGGLSEDDDDDDEEAEDDSSFSTNNSGDDGGSDDDSSDASATPPIKRCKEDGPEPKNDNGSTFKFSRIVPMTLFGKNAPPPSKAIMQIKPGSAKLAFKRKQVSNVDVVDISSGEEPARQEVPTLEAPENPVAAINPLVNLQDPTLETAESLATTVDTLVNFQELQEPMESIIASSALDPSLTRVHLQELVVASSATDPSPIRMCPQEPIIASLAITPSSEQSGADKDDEAVIAEADRVRFEAIAAIDEFLQ
ncbi:uncharacterized protein LOC112900532 [Panicum hallii]|uniref:uncharacterized protein LOC112900532 n=1 Tax=Panicum hallii TaxID=206008 RepID=UPI000DF4EF7A|nr:uncharacterized protein LOC112900532 [Panicum hallii]